MRLAKRGRARAGDDANSKERNGEKMMKGGRKEETCSLELDPERKA